MRRPRWGRRLTIPAVVLIVVGVLLGGYYGLYFALRGPLPARPQLIAHRGGPAHAPENTLAAFRLAVAAGADWLELDVQRTADGRLVVIHDEAVDRTTDGSGRVADLTLAQLRALDAGAGERVPTLEEVVELAKGAGVGLLPELKSPALYPGIETDLARALAAADYRRDAVVQSFVPEALATLQAVDPEIRVCPLSGLWVFDLGDIRPRGATVVCPMAEMALLYPWMIRRAHADGRTVFAWFGAVERPWTMRVLLALGVDGLMVDDPVALRAVLRR